MKSAVLNLLSLLMSSMCECRPSMLCNKIVHIECISFFWLLMNCGIVARPAATFSLQYIADCLNPWIVSPCSDVTRLKATYACPGAKILFNETTVLLNVSPCTLCTVHDHANFNGNWRLSPPLFVTVSSCGWMGVIFGLNDDGTVVFFRASCPTLGLSKRI